jgi:hypothetical protein
MNTDAGFSRERLRFEGLLPLQEAWRSERAALRYLATTARR